MLLDIALEEKVPVIEFSFIDPGPLVGKAKDGGARVICQVQSLKSAREAIAAGADVLVAQGNEAGGHTGSMNLLPLLTSLVEAYPDKTVKAMYWIQFEAYLPTNEYTYDYSKDEPVTFGGRPFWKSSNFGPTNNTPRAGGDGERTRQMLARAGYKLPAERMSVRLLHLVDESRRKELMIIYAEDLVPSGYSASQLLDGKEPGPEWKNIEHGLVERAKKRIKLSH